MRWVTVRQASPGDACWQGKESVGADRGGPSPGHHPVMQGGGVEGGVTGGRGPASTFPHTSGNALWLSRWGAPLTARGARALVEQYTRERFGHHVNCHLFRDCAATSLAEDNPEHVRIAADLLGHRSFATTARYYIAAGQRRALRRVQGTILAHRRWARGAGRHAAFPLESERS